MKKTIKTKPVTRVKRKYTKRKKIAEKTTTKNSDDLKSQAIQTIMSAKGVTANKKIEIVQMLLNV